MKKKSTPMKAYIRFGSRQPRQGVIWLEESINGEWDVYFPGYGENPDIAEISVKESDMALLPNGMDARINESIKAQFDK